MFETTHRPAAPAILEGKDFLKAEGKAFMKAFPGVDFNKKRIYATFNQAAEVSGVIRAERVKTLAKRLRRHNDVNAFAKAYEEAPNLGILPADSSHNNMAGVSELFDGMAKYVDRGLKEPWLLALTPYGVATWFHDIILHSKMIFGPKTEDLLMTAVGSRPEWLKESALFTSRELNKHLGEDADMQEYVPASKVTEFFGERPLPLQESTSPVWEPAKEKPAPVKHHSTFGPK